MAEAELVMAGTVAPPEPPPEPPPPDPPPPDPPPISSTKRKNAARPVAEN
jgi:hypothetical protein